MFFFVFFFKAGEIRHTVRTHGFVFEEITKKNNYLVEEGEKRGINARTDYQYIKQLKLGFFFFFKLFPFFLFSITNPSLSFSIKTTFF